MKAVILLLCLVLIQISWAEVGHDVSEQLNSDAGEVLGRHVREKIQKPKKKKKNAKKLRKGNKKTNANNKGNKKSKTRKNSKGKGRKSGGKNSKKLKPRKSGKGKGRKNEKENSKKPKTRKSGKGKGRKNGKKNSKKPKARKNGKKNSKKPKARKNEKKNSKKSKTTENKRNKDKKYKPKTETETECFTNLCAKSKKFNLYQTQMRIANRIQTWVELMDKKKEKAITTFKNASNAIKSSTTNGDQCDGGAIPNDAKVAYETLQLCNTTATEACSSSNITGLNTTLVTECIPKLKIYVDAYKVGCFWNLRSF